MRKRTSKKLTLNKETLIHLVPSELPELREVVGGATQQCTTETVQHCTLATCNC